MIRSEKHTLLSIGQIARRIGHPRDRVAYVIARDQIRPHYRVGLTNAYGCDVVDMIQAACNDISTNGKRRHSTET